jgi:hypothetical protein
VNKKVISGKALKHEKLPIKAIKESSGWRQRAHVEIITHSWLPLSPPVNKLSKADLPVVLI